jgi:predicted DNA-binding protein
MKKNISVNLDISVIKFLDQLAKLENRNKSNLLNEIIKNYYENLTLRQQIKLSRIENFDFINGVK